MKNISLLSKVLLADFAISLILQLCLLAELNPASLHDLGAARVQICYTRQLHGSDSCYIKRIHYKI